MSDKHNINSSSNIPVKIPQDVKRELIDQHSDIVKDTRNKSGSLVDSLMSTKIDIKKQVKAITDRSVPDKKGIFTNRQASPNVDRKRFTQPMGKTIRDAANKCKSEIELRTTDLTEKSNKHDTISLLTSKTAFCSSNRNLNKQSKLKPTTPTPHQLGYRPSYLNKIEKSAKINTISKMSNITNIPRPNEKIENKINQIDTESIKLGNILDSTALDSLNEESTDEFLNDFKQHINKIQQKIPIPHSINEQPIPAPCQSPRINIENFELKIQELERRLQVSENKNQSLAKAITYKETVEDNLNTELKATTKDLEKKDLSIQRLNQEIKAKTKDQQVKNKLMEEMRIKLLEVEKQLEKENQQAKDGDSEKIEQLNKALTKEKCTKEKVIKLYEKAMEQIKDLKQANAISVNINNNEINEKSENYQSCISDLNKEMKRVTTEKSKLEITLQSLEKKYEDLLTKDGKSTKEYMVLSQKLEKLENENEKLKLKLEGVSKDSQTIKTHLNAQLSEYDTLKYKYDKIVTELNEKEEEIKYLNNKLEKSDQKLDRNQNEKLSLATKLNLESQNEIERLVNKGQKLTDEISKLKQELKQTNIDLTKKDESLFMHQRILRIRSELIGSLKNTDDSLKSRMDTLYSEMVTKDRMLQQRENQLSSKNEEFVSLNATLTTTKSEMSRQEDIIKSLEAGYRRSRRIRAKQEERIQKLEEVINQLHESYAKNDRDKQNAVEKNCNEIAEMTERNLETKAFYRKRRSTEIVVRKYNL